MLLAPGSQDRAMLIESAKAQALLSTVPVRVRNQGELPVTS